MSPPTQVTDDDGETDVTDEGVNVVDGSDALISSGNAAPLRVATYREPTRLATYREPERIARCRS